MKIEDFYKLSIEQIIYFKNQSQRIYCLSKYQKPFGFELVVHLCDGSLHYWDKICDDCSLEAPAVKKRYWAWKLITNFGWSKIVKYYDDDFKSILGDSLKFEDGWDISKRKMEDDFIDV